MQDDLSYSKLFEICKSDNFWQNSIQFWAILIMSELEIHNAMIFGHFWTQLSQQYIYIYIYFPHLEYFFPIVDWSFIREERNLECFSDDQGPGPQGSRRSMNVKKAFSHIGTYTYISIYHGRITFWSSLEFFSAFLATMCRVEWMHVQLDVFLFDFLIQSLSFLRAFYMKLPCFCCGC